MIGILKNNISRSHKDFFAIRSVNQVSRTSLPSCLFCNTIDPNFPLTIETTVLQQIEAFSFEGVLITDDLLLTQMLVNIPCAKKRYLYIYDMEWKYINGLRFTQLEPIFYNEDIDLIVRSEYHFDLVSKLFKPPAHIMEYWDHNVLQKIGNSHDQS